MGWWGWELYITGNFLINYLKYKGSSVEPGANQMSRPLTLIKKNSLLWWGGERLSHSFWQCDLTLDGGCQQGFLFQVVIPNSLVFISVDGKGRSSEIAFNL